MSGSEFALLGQVVLGYAAQWLRGLKNVSNWFVWVGLAASSVLVYVWVTPTFGNTWHTNWRAAVAGLVSFLLASRGSGSAAKDVKIAPPANSI